MVVVEQEIDGSSFLELTEKDLIEGMKMKIGPTKNILKIIKENRSQAVVNLEVKNSASSKASPSDKQEVPFSVRAQSTSSQAAFLTLYP